MDAPLVLNLIIIIVILFIVLLLIYIRVSNRKEFSDDSLTIEPAYNLSQVIDFIKDSFNELTNTNLYDLGLTEEEFNRRVKKRAQLIRALKECSTGDTNSKGYVKSFIYDLLEQNFGMNESIIDNFIPFNDSNRLSSQDKFEVLMHLYQKKFKYDALSELIRKYKLDELRKVGEHDEKVYAITRTDIDFIYNNEIISLSLEDKIQILSQRIYQEYKGFGIVDDIRDMKINGVSGGVSGIPSSSSLLDDIFEFDSEKVAQQLGSTPHDYDSVWVFFEGKQIHFSFLSFGSEAELKRVCQNIYKYNNPGQLTDTNGYKVNDMKDGSRIVVVRPSFSESWAFFVRKFDLPNAKLEKLVPSPKVSDLLKYIAKGEMFTAITGEQGAGKTTLLMALIKYINPTYPLRVQEMAFELHLRKIYPFRDILTFRETDTISGQQGLDLSKKTDGAVTILGEAATDEVVVLMIQMSQVASKFSFFTHHAKRFPDLINNLRNALLKQGVFRDEKLAEKDVIEAIKFDVHISISSDGNRFIERITECIPIISEPNYDISLRDTVEDHIKQLSDNLVEYFKSTNKKLYEYRDIIRYEEGNYKWVNSISERNVIQMMSHMNNADKEAFLVFLIEATCESDDLNEESKESFLSFLTKIKEEVTR